jgi:hypothetical protein
MILDMSYLRGFFTAWIFVAVNNFQFYQVVSPLAA